MIKRVGLFILSIILMGLWFPVSFFRKDERHFFTEGFGLFTKLGKYSAEDSVEEAYRDIGKDGRWTHSIKNILHEWTKESPKRAAKFLSFVILVQFVIIILMI